MDFQQQRDLMVERQLRTVGVLDEALLSLFQQVPREHFVPDAYRALAYADTTIPLTRGQEMLRPSVQAQMLQALALKPSDHVLEVGTGTGYLTAILAKQAHAVTSVEIDEDVLIAAQQKLTANRILNVTLQCRDYAAGPHDGIAQYDAILFNGALPTLPRGFYDILRPEGRIVAILGQPPAMRVCLIKAVAGQWRTEVLFETVAPYLINAVQPDAFHF